MSRRFSGRAALVRALPLPLFLVVSSLLLLVLVLTSLPSTGEARATQDGGWPGPYSLAQPSNRQLGSLDTGFDRAPELAVDNRFSSNPNPASSELLSEGADPARLSIGVATPEGSLSSPPAHKSKPSSSGGFVLPGPVSSKSNSDPSPYAPVYAPLDDCLAWRIVDNPTTVQGQLWDVKALSSSDVWAVGSKIKHWDGTAWTVVPGLTTGGLHGISALAANDIWAVGTDNDTALTMHWNGSAWTTVPNPATSPSALYAVSARNSSDIWAVGTTGHEPSWQAFAMHWNGSAWSVSTVPAPPATGEQYELYGVTAIAADNAWAVGDYDPAEGFTMRLIMHWDGSAWTVTTGPNTSLIGYLRDVAAISANDIWAVGSRPGSGFGAADLPLALHWDGTRWSSYYLPLPSGVLYGLSALATNDVWAVGTYDSSRPAVTVHWDGTSWSVLLTQKTDSEHEDSLDAISAPSPGDVFAVGNDYDEYSADRFSLIERYNSAPCPTALPTRTPLPTPACGWVQVSSPSRPSGGNSIYGMAAVSPTNIWAVGTGGGRTLTLHWDGAAWTEVASPSPGTLVNALYSVTATSANELWAVGAYSDGDRTVAMILRGDGATWSRVDSPNPGWIFSELRGVTAVPGNGVWAVGASNQSYTSPFQTLTEHWTGTSWEIIASPNPDPYYQGLNAIAAVSSTEMWAVGYMGRSYDEQVLILRWLNGAWTVSTPPPYTYHSLLAVAVVSETDVWAAGDLEGNGSAQGKLLHWDGTAWNAVYYERNSSFDVLYSLAAVSANNIWASSASSYSGILLHYDGTTWTADLGFEVPDVGILNAVVVASPGDVWAGGWSNSQPYQNHWGQKTLLARNDRPCGTPTNTPTATPTLGAGEFYDVPPGSTFYPFVHCLALRGIISGYADGTFRPNNPVTRGQLSKIVSNSAGYTETFSTNTFEDVPVGSTFFLYVERLFAHGGIQGYACGNPEPCVPPTNKPYFRPAANVTRGQTSKIVAIAKGLPAPSPGQQTFEDVAPNSTFWQWIEPLAATGAIGGYPCGGVGEECVPPNNRPYFRPGANVTRGQSAKIVSNTFFPNCSTPIRR